MIELDGLDAAIGLLEQQRKHILMAQADVESANFMTTAIREAFSKVDSIENDSALREIASGGFTVVSLLGTTVPQALKNSSDHYHVELVLDTEVGQVQILADVVENHVGKTVVPSLDMVINDKLVEVSDALYICCQTLISQHLMHLPERDKNSKSVFSDVKCFEIIELINEAAEANKPANNIYPISFATRVACTN